MPGGGTSTARARVVRLPAGSGRAPRRWALTALATAAAVVALLALAVAVLGTGYVLIRVGGRLGAGDAGGAARWATMLFFAAAPLLLAYGAHAIHAHARARLGGAPAAIDVRAAALPAAVIVAAVALQSAFGAGSYFVTDDWLHIAIAHDAATGGGLSMEYLGRIVFIHYAPGHRLVYYVLDQLAPLGFAAALAVMLALFAASLAVFHRICVRLFGPTRWNLLLLGLFGTSVLLVPSVLWLADAIHKFPSMLLSLVAIDAYLTYRVSGRRRALAVAVAAVALGSMFYAKALLVPLYLFLIRVLFLERRPQNALRILVRERWAWLAFAPIYAIYLLNHFLTYAGEGIPPPSLDLLGKYLWLAWFHGVAPGFFGVHVAIDAQPPELLMAFAAQGFLLAAIVLSIKRKQSAWRAWAFWAVAFAANATVVGLGRLGSLGLKQVGSQLRYDTEMTWLLPLALGFAFFPGDVAGRAAEPSKVRWRWLRPRRVRVAIVAVALCAYLAATIDTGRDTALQWQREASDQSKAYAANMQRDAARLKRAGASLDTIDDQTPAFLIGPRHRPWNRLERLGPAIAPELSWVPAAPAPLQVHQDGRVTEAVVQGLAGGPTAIADAGALSLRGGRRSSRGRWPCVAAAGGPATIVFSADEELEGQSLFGLIAYDVLRPGRGPALIGGDTYRGRRVAVPLRRGRSPLVLNLGHRLRVRLPRGSSVCLRSSAVGWISP